MSTIAFTLLFAVWLMFGILGVPIQEELGLTDVQLSWISALAVLNGSMWRLPAGIITGRIGGRTVTSFLLFASAIPAYFVARAGRYGVLPLLAYIVGLALVLPGSAGPRARGVRGGQRRRFGDEVHRTPAHRRDLRCDLHPRHPGRVAAHPGDLRRPAHPRRVRRVVHRPAGGPRPGQ